jgi:hypothetical protein
MFIRQLLFLYLLLFGTLLNAQRLKSSNGSTIGYIENGRVKSSNGSRWTKMQQKNRNQLKYSELRSFFAETEGFEPFSTGFISIHTDSYKTLINNSMILH